MPPRPTRRSNGSPRLSGLYAVALTGTLAIGLISGQWTLFLLTLASPFVLCLAGYATGPWRRRTTRCPN